MNFRADLGQAALDGGEVVSTDDVLMSQHGGVSE